MSDLAPGTPEGPEAGAWAALQAPFTGDEIGKLPKGPKIQGGNHPRCNVCGSKHPAEGYFHVDYVGHAHITERLNSVDPGWRMRKGPIQFDTRGMAYMEVELTVLGVTREEVGCAETGLAEWPKLLYSDCLTRAAMRFGLALDLWKKVKGGGEYRVPGGEPTRRSEGQGGARGGSGAGGAPKTQSPSVGVLFDQLRNLASTLGAGKDEWDNWKVDTGFSTAMAADGGKVTEAKRERLEAGLRMIREIKANEQAAAGAEPWPAAGEPGDPLPVPASELDGPDPGEADADDAAADDAQAEADRLGDVEGYSDYG